MATKINCHPLTSIIYKFQKTLQYILSKKVEKEVKEIIDTYITSESAKGTHISANEVKVQHVIDGNTSEIFKWLLERSVLQIKTFAQIIQMIIALFYGDMKQNEN